MKRLMSWMLAAVLAVGTIVASATPSEAGRRDGRIAAGIALGILGAAIIANDRRHYRRNYRHRRHYRNRRYYRNRGYYRDRSYYVPRRVHRRHYKKRRYYRNRGYSRSHNIYKRHHRSRDFNGYDNP